MARRQPVTLVVRPEKFIRALVVDGPKAVRKAVIDTMRDLRREFVIDFQRTRLRGRPGLKRRTGALARSFGGRVHIGKEIEDIALHVGFGPPVRPFVTGVEDYVNIHEFGGTIRAKGKFLAIPLAPKGRKTPPFLSPRELPGKPIFIRPRAGAAKREGPKALLPQDRPIFFPRKSGQGWVVVFGGAPVFVLVRSVRIPKRLGFRAAVRKFRPKAARDLRNSIVAGVRKRV